MKFNKQAPAPMSPRAALQAKYNQSRANLLLVVITSVINLFTVAFAGSYFLFAPSMPTLLVEIVLMEAGEAGVELAALVVPFIVGLVLTAPYLLGWIFSKKRVGWMIAALVFFSLDCVYLLLMYQLTSVIIDILFHAWIMFYLITGVINGLKLKDMPEDQPLPEMGAAEGTSEASFDTFDQKDFDYSTASSDTDRGDAHVAKSDKE